jgi:hypothetical protein
MSSVQPAMIRWWQGEEKILYIFALYGLAAGILSYIASLSYDDQFTEGIAATANFPSLMILLSIEWFVMNPNGFSILKQSIHDNPRQHSRMVIYWINSVLFYQDVQDGSLRYCLDLARELWHAVGKHLFENLFPLFNWHRP